MNDQCGPIGSILTNPIIALPPGQVSTYSAGFPFTIGEQYYDPNGVIGGMFLGYAKPLITADLACPTFGVGLTTSAGSTYATYGPPYLPIIIPPPQLLDLDPEWKRLCTGFLSNSPGLRSFAIFDPPRVLTPVGGFFSEEPTPLPVAAPAVETPKSNTPGTPPAQPVQIKSPSIPEATNSPDPGLSSPKISPVDPKKTAPDPAKNTEPTVDQLINPEEPPPVKPAKLETEKGQVSTKSGSLVSIQGSIAIPPKSPDQANKAPTPTEEQQAPPAINLPPQNNNPPPFKPIVVTAAGQTFKAEPTAISIAGATLLPGGGEITIAGTRISLAPSGTLLVNNSPIPIPQPPSKPSAVFTVGDQTFEANPTGFSIAGARVKPGDAPVIVSGTSIALDKLGELVIGSSSIQISRPEATPVLTVGGQIVTPNPAGFVVAGLTVLPGAAPLTISGTSIALNQDGGLIVGSSTVKLSPQTPTSNIITAEGFTFTAGPLQSNVVVDGATLVAGGPATSISGTPISLGIGGNLVIGSKTIDAAGQTPTPNTFSVDGLAFTVAPSGSAVAINGATLAPGGPGTTVAGTSVILQPDGKLVGSKTIDVPTQAPSSNIFTVGSLTFTAAPSSSAVAIFGTTLIPGGPGATIAGTSIALQSNGKLIIGSKTIDVPTQAPSSNTFTVGNLIFTASPSSSAVAVSGTTLIPGGPGATIAGTSIALQSNGKLIIGSKTIDVPTQAPNSNIFTVGSLIFTASPSSSVVAISGTTLTPGGPGATISGTSITLQPNGNLIVGDETLHLPASTPPPSIFTSNGLTFTSESSHIVVDGTTLLPGGPGATVAGTPVSVAPGGSLVVGSSTISAQAFEGGAGRMDGRGGLVLGFMVGGVLGVWLMVA